MADVKKVIELEIDVDTGEVKDLNREVGKVGKGLKSAQKGTKGLSKGFKGVGLAIKAAGIGLLLGVLAKLTDLFSQNQSVVDKFNTAMTGLGIAFNDFFDFISDNIGTVTGFFKDLFENPQENLIKFGNLIKENLIERFRSMLDMMGLLAKAVKHLFLGEWDEALSAASEAGKELVDVYTGVDDSFDKITETVIDATSAIADYTKSTWEQAEAITEARKQMQFSEVESRKLQLAYQLQAEELRQIRDDETKSFEERIDANKRLGEVLVESAEAEKGEIQKRIDALANENSQLGITQERLLAIEALKVEQLDIDERIAGFRSEQLVNENSLLREQEAIRSEMAKKELEAAKLKADQLKELDEKRAASQLATAANTLNAISVLNNAFVGQSKAAAKRQFQIQKAVSIGQAVISGIQGVQAAFTSNASNIPATVGSLGAWPFVQAAAAGVFASANIAAIASQKFEGGGGSMPTASSGGGGATTSSIPSFNTIGSSNVNQLSEAIAGQNNQPMRAYVVANDVNSAQSLERNRQNNATFP